MSFYVVTIYREHPDRPIISKTKTFKILDDAKRYARNQATAFARSERKAASGESYSCAIEEPSRIYSGLPYVHFFGKSTDEIKNWE